MKEATLNIDHKILLRIVLVTVMVILAYIAFDIIIGIKKDSYLVQSCIILIWMITLLYVIKGKHLEFIKHFTIIAMMLSVYAGYFALNGIHGVTIIDFFNLLFVISILSEGYIRVSYWLVHFSIVTLLVYINFNKPELIINTYKDFNDIHLVFGSGIRMINTLVIATLIRNQFNKETTQINQMNQKLQGQNKELISLNDEITQQTNELAIKNEYINSINIDLEKEVEKRTKRVFEQNQKLIEYAYFNAHKVRGPLARILGLSYLIKIDKNISKDDLLLYSDLMHQNANELNEVVKNINDLLTEDQFKNNRIKEREI